MTQEPPIHTPSAVVPSEADERRSRASEVLADFLERDMDARVTLGDLVRLFGDRAFGMLLLILAIPNVVPMPGLSTLVGIPMILLGLQMMAGSHQPWLPRRVADAGFDREAFHAMIRRVQPRIERVERHLRPRLPQFTEGVAERLLGLAVVVLAAVLSLPIVFGNLPPAIAIALIALGLIEKDGAFVVAGLITSVLALLWVGSLVFGLGGAAVFLFDHAFGR